MKNLVIGVLVIGVLVTGYIAANSNLKMKLDALEGKQGRIIRGDLTLPINATGEVRPAVRVEIKSEASGEVTEVAKHPGDRVKAGDLIIRLRRDDEERNVEKTKLDLKSASARLEEAKLNLEQMKGPELDSAISKVTQLKESLRLAKYQKEKLDRLPAEQKSEEEILQRDTAYQRQLAQLVDAEAGVARVRLGIPQSEQKVKQAEASHDRVANTLADAEKILSKTDIVAPFDGIIGDVKTQVGHVIQGGKTTFTGGTILGTLLDMDRLIVGAEVDESDIERVRDIAPPWAIPGHDDADLMPENLDEAARAMDRLPVITVESFRDQEFRGVIERIYPEPRTISGVVTYLVDVVITSPNRSLLLPGMRADVRFTSEHIENAVLCPNEAIREDLNGQLGVHIPVPDGGPNDRETEFIPCKFGLSNGNYAEVLCDELKKDMKVYTQLPVKQDKDG